jgi:pimeloyl-ACP methyl ester carboxylesterase
MGIDQELLDRHRRYSDAEAGISEEFLQPTLGLGKTVGILSSPLSPARRVGFVICHSFGLEQIHLSRFDALTARAMAAAGFTVLRFHGHGYGDSAGSMEAISLSSHLAEATDAVRLLRERDEVEHVGVMGARVGGLVAALVADREDLPFMALWDPVVSGALYMRYFLRSQLLHKIVQQASVAEEGPSPGRDLEPGITASELREQLRSRGWADIKGFLLTGRAHDEFASADLLKDMTRFRGKALVVSPSRTERMTPAVAKLVEHLGRLGAECTARVVRDRAAGQFGLHHHANVPGGTKVDLQFTLSRSLAETTVAWARGAAPLSAETPEGGRP